MIESLSQRRSKLAEIDAIYRTAPIGLCVLDRDLRYIRINERLAEINGVAAAAHIGRRVRDLLPVLADRLEPIFRKILASGAPVIGLELHGQTPAHPGIDRIFVANYVPLRDQHDRILGLNVSVEEVTALRRLEAERARQTRLRALASRLQAVREEERTRVARELHDELGQSLTAVKLGLRWIGGRMAPKPRVALRIRQLDLLLDDTMKTVRRISGALRPPLLDLIGLAAAIRESAKEFEAATGIRCHVTVPRTEPALSAQTATAVFRIFQEALTNVSRHAHATRVEVSLRHASGIFSLEVRDDGRGITDAAIDDLNALGLLGMRERALAVGGAVTIGRHPAGGTGIDVTVPVLVRRRPGPRPALRKVAGGLRVSAPSSSRPPRASGDPGAPPRR